MTLKMNNPVAVAATKSGFSQASGDRLKASSKLPSQKKAPRSRCRLDSLGEIFEAEVLSLLKSAPGLRPAAIFEELQRRHADLSADIRRTLERRIRAWRAEHEPEQEVMFRLVHEPDKMGLSDFTEMGKRCMAIADEPLAHRLHRFRLAYSGFEHAQVFWVARPMSRWRKACRMPSVRSAACLQSIAPTAFRRHSRIWRCRPRKN